MFSARSRKPRIPSTTSITDEEKRKHMSQPVINQPSNVEQKNKAKKRRESRRSTQVRGLLLRVFLRGIVYHTQGGFSNSSRTGCHT